LNKEGKMLDHSAVSIIPFLLAFCCYLFLLLVWLPGLLRRQGSDGPEALPDGPTKAPGCPACAAEKSKTASEHREPPPRIEQHQGRPREVDTCNHFCPNQECRYYGWVDRGNIRANGRPNGGRWRQLQCLVCRRYFMETTGTIFFGKQALPETIWRALTALAEGLGIRATARVFDVDPDTVKSWLEQAAGHMEAVSGYLIHDLALTQVQIDELWALLGKHDRDDNQEKSKAKRWVWVGIDPVSKLWLASVVGDRSKACAQLLIHAIYLLLAPGCLPLFVSDQWAAYASALLTHFGHWVSVPRRYRLGRPPKPRWQALPGLLYAQVVKQRHKGRVIGVTQRVVYGGLEQIEVRLAQDGVGQGINTAFIERLNLTIRQLVSALARKVITLAKSESGLETQLSLCRAYYNFCLPHVALRLPLAEPQPTKGNGSPKKWQPRSPAMAADLTDQLWRLQDLLLLRAPPWQRASPTSA
jgi:IS1 family transposase/transposase-like protein